MLPNEARNFYPTGQDLAAMGQTLARDVVLWSARLAREYATAPTVRELTPDARREYDRQQRAEWVKRNHNKPKDTPARVFRSKYVGVTQNRGRWCGSWLANGGWRQGPVRPQTEQGERWAAQDRARAMGREYIELRDGTRVVYLWKATEEMTG